MSVSAVRTHPLMFFTSVTNFGQTCCERASLCTGGVFVGCLWIQLLLSETGYFNSECSAAILLAGGAFFLATFVNLVSALGRRTPSEGFRFLGILSVIVVAFALAVRGSKWVHPTENLLGDNDEGVYAVSAINMARTGSYFLNASLVPSLPSKFQPWVLKHEPLMANRTLKPPERFLCYHTCLFVADPEHGLLAPQFPPGFPLLLGSIYSFFGYTGLRAVNLLLTICTAWLAGLLAVKWLGKTEGLAVTVLMLWFPLQVWVSNTLFAEPFAQMLWLLVMLGFAEREESPCLTGLLAGSAAGFALAVKIDALPVAAVIFIALLIAWKQNRRFAAAGSAALILTGAFSLWGWWRFNRHYVASTLRSLAETNRAPLIIAVILGAVVFMVAAALIKNETLRKTWSRHGSAGKNSFLSVSLLFGLALAGYAYFVRSHPSNPDSFYYWPVSHDIRSHREETFFRLGWYWQPWGLAVSVLGLGVLISRARKQWHWLFLGIGLLFLISFCYDLRNNPIQPYGMRRFLPYAVPIMIFGAVEIWSWLKNKMLRTGLTAVTSLALASGFYLINEKLNNVGEFSGLIGQIDALAKRLPANAILLIPDNSLLVRLATPLEFVFGKPSLVIRSNMPSVQFEEATRNEIYDWEANGRRVFLLTSRPGQNLPLFNVQVQLLSQGGIKTMATTQSAESLVTIQSEWNVSWALGEMPRLAASAPHSPQGTP